MLKIVSLADYDGQIERFDDDRYVGPIFNVRIGRKQHHTEPPAIWRVESPPKRFAGSNLLYVWVRRSNGSIRDIEFVGIRKECIEFVDDDFEFLRNGVPGLPIVDMTLWDGPGVEMWGWGIWPTISEGLPLKLFVGTESYSLQIGDAVEAEEVIAFDQFRVALDHLNNLRRIDVIGVRPEKIQALREWKGSPPSGFPPTKGGLPRRLRWEIGVLLSRMRWKWLRHRSR